MTCDIHSNGCGCCCNGTKNSPGCIFDRVVKALLQITKVTALVGLTLVLFDIHAGLKAQFEGMQAQQAMMMNAGAAAAATAPNSK